MKPNLTDALALVQTYQYEKLQDLNRFRFLILAPGSGSDPLQSRRASSPPFTICGMKVKKEPSGLILFA